MAEEDIHKYPSHPSDDRSSLVVDDPDLLTRLPPRLARKPDRASCPIPEADRELIACCGLHLSRAGIPDHDVGDDLRQGRKVASAGFHRRVVTEAAVGPVIGSADSGRFIAHLYNQ